MLSRTSLQIAATVCIFGAAIVLAAGAYVADDIRARYVFTPAEKGVEAAIQQVADRERAIHASTGNFVRFASADVERGGAPLGLPWERFPVSDFFFDATALDSGNVRLRAVPRPESVASLSVRAKLYAAELNADGEIVGSGWYPSSE